MPREDPQNPTSPIKDMMLPKAKKGHGPVICYRGNKEMRLLTLYYSYRGNKSRARQRKRVPRQWGPRTNPLFAAEKEWRSTRIVLGLLVSMTKMVLFASLLFDVLRFNYKGRKYQDSHFPQDFLPNEAWEHFLLDHISRRWLFPWCPSTKPKKQYYSPKGYHLLERERQKSKNRREDMLK